MWATASTMTEDDCRAPSLLPGWTRGHVLTHWARNADGQTRMLLAATRGKVVAQYPGGDDQRETDIEAGAARSAPLILQDARTAVDQVEDVWRHMRGLSSDWPFCSSHRSSHLVSRPVLFSPAMNSPFGRCLDRPSYISPTVGACLIPADSSLSDSLSLSWSSRSAMVRIIGRSSFQGDAWSVTSEAPCSMVPSCPCGPYLSGATAWPGPPSPTG
jgi:hypothetical protein